MKLSLTIVAAASALALAAPAAAQYGSQQPGAAPYGSQSYDPRRANDDNFADRLDQLEDRLEAGIDDGTIDRTEARSLRLQIRQLTRLESQYGRDGLSQDERRDLQQRLRTVRRDLRLADGGNNGRYADWNRDWDRDERSWQDGPGRGSRYQEVGEVCSQQRANAMTAILRNIFGTDNCLRVGERVTATASMSALPSQYRSEFRERSGVAYRYLEGNVIEIDTRTNVVTRIYDVA